MASIERREGKNGISYRIVVFQGRDMNGKLVRNTMTWAPAPGMTEKKMEKEVQRIAFEFEQAIAQGYQVDDKQTFSEYARYVIDLKEQSGVKHRTVVQYKKLVERCDLAIGHMKLTEIRPKHLNSFYKNLKEEGLRKGTEKAVAKVDIKAALKAKGITKTKAVELANTTKTTLDNICNGRTVRLTSAEAVAKVIGKKVTDLFTIERDMRPLSPKTQLEYHRFIHLVLEQAEKEMIVPYNAAAKATPPKTTQKEVNYFQAEDITAILDALEQEPIKWRTFVHLLMVTGCRRGEIAGLKWGKVDFDKSQIRIDTNLLYTPERGTYEDSTKTGDTRLLALPAETMQLLRKYRAWYNELRLMNGDRWQDSGFLFVQDDGKPIQPDSIGQWLSRFSKRHGLPHINAHAFRHTVASMLIHNGTDVVSVSKRLGHARTSTTTDIYAHVMQEADRQASECLADVLFRRKNA